LQGKEIAKEGVNTLKLQLYAKGEELAKTPSQLKAESKNGEAANR